jgi:hypothetical protein
VSGDLVVGGTGSGYARHDRPRHEENVMAGLLNRIKSFMRSPKGRQMTSKAGRMAKDPRNRARARDAVQKFRRRR